MGSSMGVGFAVDLIMSKEIIKIKYFNICSVYIYVSIYFFHA